MTSSSGARARKRKGVEVSAISDVMKVVLWIILILVVLSFFDVTAFEVGNMLRDLFRGIRGQ